MAENNFFLGQGYDPLLQTGEMTSDEIKERLAELKRIKQEMTGQSQGKTESVQKASESIWDKIDAEVAPLSDSQKNVLFSDEDYQRNEQELMGLIQSEMIYFLRPRVEQSEEGKKILEAQYKLVKEKKGAAIAEANKEAELFNAFREASAANPELTYAMFLEKIKQQ